MKLRKNENKELIKAAMKFCSFDYGFQLAVEKEAIILMSKYFEGSEISRDLKLAIRLLDIILEVDSAYYIFNGKGCIKCYVNTRNWNRFLPEDHSKDLPASKDALRIEKAWHLYNKLRFERMRTWWD